METRFFDEGTVPEWTTPEWYAGRERAPHLDQPGHRGRLELAAKFVREAWLHYPVTSVSDMGAGDGGLLSLIDDLDVPKWGYDLMPANVAGAAERGVSVELGNFQTDPVRWGYLCVLTEVLEHLIDPREVLRTIPSSIVVASSPDGETLDRRYEFHTYGWDMDGYRALFEDSGFHVLRHESIGFQVLAAIKAGF